MRVFRSLDELTAAVGEEMGPTDWVTITQEQVDMFADADAHPGREPRARSQRLELLEAVGRSSDTVGSMCITRVWRAGAHHVDNE